MLKKINILIFSPFEQFHCFFVVDVYSSIFSGNINLLSLFLNFNIFFLLQFSIIFFFIFYPFNLIVFSKQKPKKKIFQNTFSFFCLKFFKFFYYNCKSCFRFYPTTNFFSLIEKSWLIFIFYNIFCFSINTFGSFFNIYFISRVLNNIKAGSSNLSLTQIFNRFLNLLLHLFYLKIHNNSYYYYSSSNFSKIIFNSFINIIRSNILLNKLLVWIYKIIYFLGIYFKNSNSDKNINLPLLKLNKLQFLAVFLFKFIKNLTRKNFRAKNNSYAYLLYFLFLFILFFNLFGLLPYSFSVTAHFIVCFYFALALFISITLIGIIKHKEKFISMFLPDFVPIYIAPFIFIIEIISYVSKFLSLALRLFANLVAGHLLLKIIACFSFDPLFGKIITLLVLSVIFCLEIFVAIVQAYVFIFLVIIYLDNVINLH